MPKYSIIIPLFNRPREIDELLNSLTKQTFEDFEVIVVEDGSVEKADKICDKYRDQLDLKYFYKENEGPGQTRNYGCQQAQSGFFIFFDSDCIIPENYLNNLDNRKSKEAFDAFGGPDAADQSFSPHQKGINYSMTSVLTTGGIRGSKRSAEKFHPRSFNMGISREVYEKTGGFANMRFGEDIDFSIRINKEGFRAILIQECFVYHKRRTNFKQFYKQVFNSGIARINLYKRHPGSLKVVHFFPAVFTIYFIVSIPLTFYFTSVLPALPWLVYFLLIGMDALRKTYEAKVIMFAIMASFYQLIGYGLGFLKGIWRRLILGKPEFHEFRKSFYG